MTVALSKRVLEEYAAVSASLPADVVSPRRRLEAVQALSERGLPTTREENWRYTNLRPLERARFAPAAGSAAAGATSATPAPALPLPPQSALPPRLTGFARYTFVDGSFVPELSSPDEQAGLTVRTLRRAAPGITGSAGAGSGTAARPESATVFQLPRALPALADLPEARLALLNEAFATDIAAIHVAGAAAEPRRVELLFIAAAGADAGSSYPRVQVGLDPGSRLVLVERHIGASGAASLVNSSVSVDVGRGAHLAHYRLQRASARATWLDTLSAVLAAEARYQLLAVNTGGLSARSTTHVQMAGSGAELTLSVAALADRQQVQDNFALVEHIAPHARTEQTFRGIASGRARVAFNGKIAVREGAAGTDSRQSLRGLLAGPEAEIDVRPQLEIYTDDVRCSHGATAGKLDESMLFYLLSRGRSPEVAQRLLKWAFLEDVVSKIESPELRRQIEHDLAGQMADAASLKELL
ncbi:MAG TPA: SufD family Fe-S cluster assembly protein [Steroidobacteraceae bacterium]|nr:SufD family Fe-S cluster assembly protein [Steroidobacteraceae bacterium]